MARQALSNEFLIFAVTPPSVSSKTGIHLTFGQPKLQSCHKCPPEVSKGKNDRRNNHHARISGWFLPPVVRPEYLRHLSTLLDNVAACDTAREIEAQKWGGFRVMGDLTVVGRLVFTHIAAIHDNAEDVLEAQLFRFRVTAKARIWALADPQTGEIELLFWDPHHYLGKGHRYNHIPSNPEWNKPHTETGIPDGDL